MAECYRCPYTSRTNRTHGATVHCTLDPTDMDVTYFCFEKHKDENNELCPFVNRNTRLPGVDYRKYETEFLKVKGGTNV